MGTVSKLRLTERAQGLVEDCGLRVGEWLAPLTGALSAARRARMFHPDGVAYCADVTPRPGQQDLVPLSARLSGRALVRFSSALWRAGRELPDVLGAAVRFDVGQDLLLATIRFPWTMPFAPLATNFHSFLWNHYHAVSPFDVTGIGPVKLRLRSPRIGNASWQTRERHLRQAVDDGRARFVLELRRLREPRLTRRWDSVAELLITEPAEVDQQALRFSPFRIGAGMQPIGFVHAIRVAAYAASQEARPSHG